MECGSDLLRIVSQSSHVSLDPVLTKIFYSRLSGLSPFMGDTDVETFANITRADYDFDDDAFDAVSQEAKDFITGLLVHRKEDRMTAEQCLVSKWLSVEQDGLTDSRQSRKICTDKLKKFIIRRKWQVRFMWFVVLVLRDLYYSFLNYLVNPALSVCVCATNPQCAYFVPPTENW